MFRVPHAKYAVIAINTSKSTLDDVNYYASINKIIEQLKSLYRSLSKSSSNILIIKWNTLAQKIPLELFHKFIHKKSASGTNKMAILANVLSTEEMFNIYGKYKIDLYIITNGIHEYDNIDIERADRTLINNKFASVSGILIGPDDRPTNIIEFAPFMRGNYTIAIYKMWNDSIKSLLYITSNERINIINDINKITTYEDLMTILPQYIGIIHSKMVGGSNILTSTLRLMHESYIRAIKRIREYADKLHATKYVKFIKELETTCTASLDTMINIHSEIPFNTVKLEIISSHIISLFKGEYINTFNYSDIHIYRDPVIKPPVPLDIKQPINKMHIIECPILLTNTKIPVIFVKKLHYKVNKRIFRNNPFNVLMSSVLDIFKGAIGHYISLEAFIASGNNLIDPIDRAECCAVIPCGDDPISIKLANNAISQIYDNIIYGNLDIWFYALYKLVADGKIPWLYDILPMIKQQMIARLLAANTTPLTLIKKWKINIKVSLAAACMYIIHQPLFIQQNSTFNQLWTAYPHMIDLIELANYNSIHIPLLNKYYRILNILNKLIIDAQSLNIPAFRTKYSCIIMNHIHVPDEHYSVAYKKTRGQHYIIMNWIVFDSLRPPGMNINHIMDDYPGISSKLIYNLSNLITSIDDKLFNIAPPILSLDDINMIDDEIKPVDILVNYLPDWISADNIIYRPPICSLTMRPFSMIENKHWTICYCDIYNRFKKYYNFNIFKGYDRRPAEYVFSGYSLYAKFILKHKFYPEFADYITYCYNEIYFSSKRCKTLPSYEWLIDIYDNYRQYHKDIPVDEFIRRYVDSTNKKERIKLETIY